MSNCSAVILRGIGGNFKSSIAKEMVKSGFTMIPEANREFEHALAKFDRVSDTELNYCSKYIMIKGILANKPCRVVSDRGLIDYAMMSQFVKKILMHYDGCQSDHLDPEEVYKEECAVFNGCSMINVLLLTTDKKFLKKIIDDSFDTRACFFDNTDDYLACQELYKKFVLDHYANVITIELDHIPEVEKYSPEMDELVKNTTMRIFSEMVELNHKDNE